MKRFIICCDGTWSTPDDQEHGQSCATNVAKIAELISPVDANGTQQITYYQDGGGSGNLEDRPTGGAMGMGLSKNIEDVYRFLAANYVKGDEIWLFGFSRGAYIARSIVGLIRNSGLLEKEHLEKFGLAYQLYRDRSKDTHPDQPVAKQFKAQFSYTPEIRFLGIWDTVGSLGVPDHILSRYLSNMWNFHDVTLSSIVTYAFHALAIDEQRDDFKPCVWEGSNTDKRQQVWFPGAHSDVGSGYPEAGLSDCALAWMMCRAEACGLEFDRANLKVKPDQLIRVHDARSGILTLRPRHERIVEPNLLSEAALRKKADKKQAYSPANWPDTVSPLPCAQNCAKAKGERCWS